MTPGSLSRSSPHQAFPATGRSTEIVTIQANRTHLSRTSRRTVVRRAAWIRPGVLRRLCSPTSPRDIRLSSSGISARLRLAERALDHRRGSDCRAWPHARHADSRETNPRRVPLQRRWTPSAHQALMSMRPKELKTADTTELLCNGTASVIPPVNTNQPSRITCPRRPRALAAAARA
jgi:hypothetical protein